MCMGQVCIHAVLYLGCVSLVMPNCVRKVNNLITHRIIVMAASKNSTGMGSHGALLSSVLLAYNLLLTIATKRRHHAERQPTFLYRYSYFTYRLLEH